MPVHPVIFATIIITLIFSTPALSVTKSPFLTPWLRLDGDIAQSRLSPRGKYLAFTDAKGENLRVIELSTRNVYLVAKHTVGPSFFWSPDGRRLFYREMSADSNEQVTSEVKAFDCTNQSSIAVVKFPSLTGLLSFDPRDMKMHFISEAGLHSKRLVFPEERLAQWQAAQRTDLGTWIPAQKGILWATDGGLTLRKMNDDDTGVQAFDISPDASAVAWSTKSGRIYTSVRGANPQFQGWGHDPRWHPEKPYLVYAAARKVGNRIADYDVRVVTINGSGKFLTHTQGISERWPLFSENGKDIIFTIEGTTDLFKLNFE